MKRKFLVTACIGIIVTLFGLLWFLQGTGFLELCPVLCFADCDCIRGGSPFWEATGAITSVIGLVIIGISVWVGRKG